MICIRDKFSQNIGRQVPSKVIWDHLSTMYDMQALVSRTPPSPRGWSGHRGAPGGVAAALARRRKLVPAQKRL